MDIKILVPDFSNLIAIDKCFMDIDMHGSGFDCNYFGNGH